MTKLEKNVGAFAEGAYGVVFFDTEGNAIKVFKNRGGVSREHVEAVFLSELRTFEIATSNELLKSYIPEFFGIIKCNCVLDATGRDISDAFHLDLSYKMKRVNGSFEKTGLNDNDLRSKFHAAGIRHTKDASVLYEENKVKCLIDFAVEEHELWHQ